MKNENSRIVIEHGEMFDGTRKQFENSFFSNGSNDNIFDWCLENEWDLKIDGKILIETKNKFLNTDELPMLNCSNCGNFKSGNECSRVFSPIEECILFGFKYHTQKS